MLMNFSKKNLLYIDSTDDDKNQCVIKGAQDDSCSESSISIISNQGDDVKGSFNKKDSLELIKLYSEHVQICQNLTD